MNIRPERPDDSAAIRQVHLEAFAASEFGHHGEADLVEQLRENCQQRLSLVAVADQLVVGHILFTPVAFQNGQADVRGMALGPMAVTPDHQHQGIGSALVRDGLARLRYDDWSCVVVLGHPKFYPRFGFQLAASYGISHGFEGIPQNVFFVKLFEREAMSKVGDGKLLYRPEFGRQHETT